MRSFLQEAKYRSLNPDVTNARDLLVYAPDGSDDNPIVNVGSLQTGNFASSESFLTADLYTTGRPFTRLAEIDKATTGVTFAVDIATNGLVLMMSGEYTGANNTYLRIGDDSLTVGDSYVEITNTHINGTFSSDGYTVANAHGFTWIAGDPVCLGIVMTTGGLIVNKMDVSGTVVSVAFASVLSGTITKTCNFADEIVIGGSGAPFRMSGLVLSTREDFRSAAEVQGVYDDFNRKGVKALDQ